MMSSSSFTCFKQTSHAFKVHIAVDFGTDGTGIAYAYNGQVIVHNRWSSKKYGDECKPKTVLLLDEKGGVLGFGADAKWNYITMPSYKNKWLLFERFKMALFEDELLNDHMNGDSSKKSKSKMSPKKQRKIGIADTLCAANGQRYGSDFVFVSAFKHIQSEALKFMRNKLKLHDVHHDEIQWIITVPAIWSDRAKHKMTSWAIAAGIVNKKIRNHLKIVYEPDCASLAIQHQMRDRHKATPHNSQLNDDVKENGAGFVIGEQYVLIDVGGGTADICCHEIVAELGVAEVMAPSGGPWGSSYIDDEYRKLLQNIFSTSWMREFQRLLPNVYVECVENFQRAKMSFFSKRKTKWHNVVLPREFCEYIGEEITALKDDEISEIEDLVERSKFAGFSNLLRFEDDVLSLDVSIWRAMFDAVIDPVSLHVGNLLKHPKMRKCQFLCLVGGLASSSYFQFKMRQQFGADSKHKLQMIVPKRPLLAVVEGAAYFGLTANYIKSRILKKTYGIKASFTESKAKANGLSKLQIGANKIFIDYYGGFFVKNCFKVLGRKNSEIVQNEVVKYSCKRQPGCAVAKIVIICSDMECPKLVTDGQVLAKLKLKFDQNDDHVNSNVTCEFHFYDTVIKVVAYCDTTPDIKQEIDVTYVEND